MSGPAREDLSAFLGGAAHDLMNLSTSRQIYTEMLAESLAALARSLDGRLTPEERAAMAGILDDLADLQQVGASLDRLCGEIHRRARE